MVPCHNSAYDTLCTCAQVWMITGDKQETAINIAVACRLVHDADDLLMANEDRSAEAAEALLHALIAKAQQRNAAGVSTGLRFECRPEYAAWMSGAGMVMDPCTSTYCQNTA